MFLKPSAALAALFVAALFAVTAAPAQAQNGAPKLAWINSTRILDEAPGARQAQQELQQLRDSSIAELEGLQQEIQQMTQEFERQQGTMSPERRGEREQEIVQRQQAFLQRQQELDQQIGQRQAELINPIFERIENVIQDIRTEGNYTMIFDRGPGTGLLAADPALNITDQVLARLRSTANNR